MVRVKLSEFKAKQLVLPALGLPQTGLQVTTENLSKVNSLPDGRYVVKVDQGVKGRMKKGLVKLPVLKKDLLKTIKGLMKLSYKQFYVDEILVHGTEDEYFLSFERVREGVQVFYSQQGGIYVEQNKRAVKKEILTKKTCTKVARDLRVTTAFLKKLLAVFEENYFSFFEVNPLVVKNGIPYFLDLAVEVDSAAEFFVRGSWSKTDIVEGIAKKTAEETAVESLSARSPSAFKLDVLKRNGAIFLLLSGGGASLVLADEVYNQGFASQLANYGEYSGNPTAEETYVYAKNLVSLLMKSKAPKKILIIGGGVANFTDVRVTFEGIHKALQEKKNELKKQQIKIFIRRGGPHEKEGLLLMSEFLKKERLLGSIAGSTSLLTEVVVQGLTFLKKHA